jgi:hypothetical protein
MKDIGRGTRRAQPTLTSQCMTLMQTNFRRGHLLQCHITALRIVHSRQLMVDRDTVTDTCCDKGRPRASRPFARSG